MSYDERSVSFRATAQSNHVWCLVQVNQFAAAFFPAIGAVVSAAAGSSKARAEMDAEAVRKVARSLAFASEEDGVQPPTLPGQLDYF